MNKEYIVISNGLFKDSFAEEAVVDKELRQKVISKSRRAGFSGPTLDIPFYTGVEGYRQFQEILRGTIQDPIIFGTAGESQLDIEQLWTDTRNESVGDIQPPTERYIVGCDPYVQIQEGDSITTTRNMTEQELINYFDTISNEEQ